MTHFGVNITVVPAGSVSALRHAHAVQDEFVYVGAGTLILHTDEGETTLEAGMCAAFKAGSGNAHRLLNRSEHEAVYLEVGDCTPGDAVSYPDDDLVARRKTMDGHLTTKTENLSRLALRRLLSARSGHSIMFLKK